MAYTDFFDCHDNVLNIILQLPELESVTFEDNQRAANVFKLQDVMHEYSIMLGDGTRMSEPCFSNSAVEVATVVCSYLKRGSTKAFDELMGLI